MPYYYNATDRQAKQLIEGIQARTFWGANMLMAVVDLDAGAVLPAHSHPHEQAGIVLEGELDFVIGGEARRLQPGDLYIIPGGVVHSVTVGADPARVLDIFSPVRTEYQY